MNFKDLKDRCDQGEVCILDNINGIYPDIFINKNNQHFQDLTIEDDQQAGVFWIYNKNIRSQNEYNPVKT